MPIIDRSERAFIGSGLLALGAAFAGLAAALSPTAFNHMIASANMCGPGVGHCFACAGVLVCVAAALIAGGSGLLLLGPRRSRIPASHG